MSYESPIKLIETMTENIVDEMNKAVDEYIYKSILNVGVDVDRDELIRALRYDRNQYEKGYRDGIETTKETMAEVVRCKDCIHDDSNDPICPIPWVKRMLDSYCSFGERRADNG